MNAHAHPRRRRGQAGFTLSEMLVVSVLGLVVILSSYQLLMSQSSLLTAQRETIDSSDTARGAATLLAWELRSASSAGADLYTIDTDSLVLRSFRATGVICAVVDSVGGTLLALRQTSGTFTGAAEDSVVAYSVAANGWRTFSVGAAYNGAEAWSAGAPVCHWGDSTTAAPRPEAALQVDTARAAIGLQVGGPVHLFRRTHYGLARRDGRWWLTRRVGTGDVEYLTGPLLPPSEGGLRFTYYDAAGAVTTDPTEVQRVEFTVLAQGDREIGRDTVNMAVFLRNNGG